MKINTCPKVHLNCLRELNKYLRNNGSAVKNVQVIQFQG